MYKYLYLKFFSLFLLFGLIITICIYYINTSILKGTINDLKTNITNSYFNIEYSFIEKTINDSKENLSAIKNEKDFIEYINTNNNQELITKIFYNFTSANHNILQLRYIDINGDEKIRIQKRNEKKEPKIVLETNLQNKKDKEYFRKTIELENDNFYISDFNLNKEFGKIQIPLHATIRIATPIYNKENIKKGILVLNIDMNKFIELFNDLKDFNSFLIDGKGNYLLHPNEDKHWSVDLKTNFNIKQDYDDLLTTNILTSNFFKSGFIYSYLLEGAVNNQQNLRIVFIPYDLRIQRLLDESNIKLLQIIVPLIVLLGIILAIYPSKIREKLILSSIKNEKNLTIINKFVPIFITNSKGVITDANEAFCELSGYTRTELIGESHDKFKSGNLEKNLYKELWKTLNKGNIWTGELENIKKNGQVYWIDIYIEPRYNEENKEKEFISISHNITDKKLTEQLAQTDHLTNLYNRKRIDIELENSLYNVKRYNENISIMMLDIDYFKLVNDKYGHNIGDSVLIEFANILKQCIRKTDLVGRWGGEEFLIIAHSTNKKDAKALAIKIKEFVSNYEFKFVGKKTISIGLTQIKQLDSNITDFISRADEALYKAKANGRNRVETDESNNLIINNYII